MQEHYDTSSDIWSLGCVLAELIHVSTPNVEFIDDLPKRSQRKEQLSELLRGRYTFVANSCYPLSPVNPGEKNTDITISSEDMLKVIFEHVNDQESLPTANSFLVDKHSLKYVSMLTKSLTFGKESKLD